MADRPSARPIARVFDLVDPASQQLYDLTPEEARQRLLSDDPDAVLGIDGSFALIARDGERVCLARSLDRPLRYFLAKEEAGPALVVAERIDRIRRHLDSLGLGRQFHPSYTRMVPAHLVTTLRLIGCPDPNPVYRRFFDPPCATLAPDLDVVGERYAGALYQETRRWLERQDPDEPLGVLFSGGIDSGAVLLSLYRSLLDLGQSPSRLKAFTLSVGGEGEDLAQARELLARVDLEMLGEAIEVPPDEIDPLAAVEILEDYKPLDVQCGAVGLALLRGIRRRYPDWRLVVTGDGGDENLKDYPIEENDELTIRSVVSNQMLYQEGWGHDSIKHSLTHTGGLSRSCVRTYAPAAWLGFTAFSPFTRPAVVAVAEAIPFAQLTGGSHERLYALKGEVVARGVRAVLGMELPVFPKRRFQHGVASRESAPWLFSTEGSGAKGSSRGPEAPEAQEHRFRTHFLGLHGAF